jgi:hypothetical protein
MGWRDHGDDRHAPSNGASASRLSASATAGGILLRSAAVNVAPEKFRATMRLEWRITWELAATGFHRLQHQLHVEPGLLGDAGLRRCRRSGSRPSLLISRSRAGTDRAEMPDGRGSGTANHARSRSAGSAPTSNVSSLARHPATRDGASMKRPRRSPRHFERVR